MRQPRPITVLGICPGIGSLAYVCARWEPGFVDGELIDHDVLRGAKPKPEDSFERLVKKAKVHTLILSVVIERNSPSIVVISPHAGKESKEAAAASGFALGNLCGDFRIVPVCFESREELFGMFPNGAEAKNIVSQRIQGGVPGARGKPLAFAAMSAIAGFEKTIMTAGVAGIIIGE